MTNAACRNYKLLDVTAVTCDRISSGALPACNGTRTTINGRIDTVALASLVRVASGFHLRPSRPSTTGMAPTCRTEMDRRHHQRFGTTLGLSGDSDLTSGLAEYLPQLGKIRRDPPRLIAPAI